MLITIAGQPLRLRRILFERKPRTESSQLLFGAPWSSIGQRRSAQILYRALYVID
jgi:hypothetical protein